MKVSTDIYTASGVVEVPFRHMQLTSDQLSNLLQRLQKVAPWRSNPVIKFKEGMIHLYPANTRPGQREMLRNKVRHAVERFVNECELYKLDPSTYITWVKSNRYTIRLLADFGLDEEDIRELAATLRSNRKVMDVKVVDARVRRDGELVITTHGHQRDEKLMSDLQGTIITVAACKHAV